VTSSSSTVSLRVAVASSGLGHVRRGIEAWAQDLAGALKRRNVPVGLFGGAPGEGGIISVGCLQRANAAAQRTAALFRELGGWRYGLGSVYEVEQLSFAFRLWPHVRRGYDILHVQDPLLARIMERLRRMKLSDAHVILANGTAERPDQLSTLSVVQELSPQGAEKWPPDRGGGPTVFMVPNFVDLGTFAPGDRRAARRRFNLPEDAFIVFCSAAIRRYHKRIDYLIEEFAGFAAGYDGPAMLVVAGGREADTDELVALGRERLGERVRFLVSAPRADMPALYRAADVFTLSSLFEAGSVALMEAMASGLPIVCNDTPNFRFAAGPKSLFADLTQPGTLAAAFAEMTRPERRLELGAAARAYAEATFSESVVMSQILGMYDRVVAGSRVGAPSPVPH
jgi:glycosyltransferase involved in cell wall biosynthesis